MSWFFPQKQNVSRLLQRRWLSYWSRWRIVHVESESCNRRRVSRKGTKLWGFPIGVSGISHRGTHYKGISHRGTLGSGYIQLSPQNSPGLFWDHTTSPQKNQWILGKTCARMGVWEENLHQKYVKLEFLTSNLEGKKCYMKKWRKMKPVFSKHPRG